MRQRDDLRKKSDDVTCITEFWHDVKLSASSPRLRVIPHVAVTNAG